MADSGRLRTVDRDPDAPLTESSGSGFRVRQDSMGVRWIAEARAAQDDPAAEADLGRRLAQLEDVSEGVKAVVDLAGSMPVVGRAAKRLGILLATAVFAHPVIAAFMPDAEITTSLAAIQESQRAGKAERRGLAVYMWQVDQCRTDASKCPKQPPATVRLMLAQDELDQ